MRSVYERCLEEIEKGVSFKVDFNRRNLRIGSKFPILNGKFKGKLGADTAEWQNRLEELYGDFLISTPDAKTKRSYFYAKPYEKLTKSEMVAGERRNIAQFKLEFFFLACLLNGLEWNEEWGSWFWASKKYNKLVVMRDWFKEI